MSTKPEAGSPDELAWLRGFEEARNHFLDENARLRDALEWMIKNEHLTILIDEPEQVAHFMSRARAALDQK